MYEIQVANFDQLEFRPKAILVRVCCDEKCVETECFDLIDKVSVKMVFISTECVYQARGL